MKQKTAKPRNDKHVENDKKQKHANRKIETTLRNDKNDKSDCNKEFDNKHEKISINNDAYDQAEGGGGRVVGTATNQMFCFLNFVLKFFNLFSLKINYFYIIFILSLLKIKKFSYNLH